MYTIHKYTLKISNTLCYISLPIGALVLSVEEQMGNVVIFVQEENHKAHESKIFLILKTNQNTEFDLAEFTFLNTVKTSNANFYHIYFK